MNPASPLVDWLARRYDQRALAKATVGLVACLLVTQATFLWYAGSLGTSLRATAYSDDDRTVVIDRADRAAFARAYSEDTEEGWCLYGTANETHIRIDDVVHARALTKTDDRIAFTCVPESARRLVRGQDPRLLGVVHSHPDYNRSFLSRLDLMLWGRVSPLVELMGVYTEPDGVEFFTAESLTRPLDTLVVDGDRTWLDPGPDDRPRNGSDGTNASNRTGGNGTASDRDT